MGGEFSRSALLLFAKEPAPGRVKTRLGQVIGMDLASDLAWALLDDCLALARQAADRRRAALWLIHAPDSPTPGFSEWVSKRAPSAHQQAQGEGDLGARLARGLSRIDGPRVALGMDAPDLPSAQLEAAFAGLEGHDVVLGPAADGGYHLLGLGPGVGCEFLAEGGIRWSSACTLEDTVAAARAQGHSVTLLANHDDVDDLASLRTLSQRVRAGAHAPATAAWLAAHPEALR